MNRNRLHFLTYCTNIHGGELWSETFGSIRRYTPGILGDLTPCTAAGTSSVGVRLSGRAASVLNGNSGGEFDDFIEWLARHSLSVTTLNAFPFGTFHGVRVKEQVYEPDWFSPERVRYTKDCISVLHALLRTLRIECDGSISTCPVGYRYNRDLTTTRSCDDQRVYSSLADIVHTLHTIYSETGVDIHLDLEPEPDCIIDSYTECLTLLEEHLFPGVAKALSGFSSTEAEEIIRRHLAVCFDVCHASVRFEDPVERIQAFQRSGIRVGKIQLSSTVTGAWTTKDEKAALVDALQPFLDDTYLHQCTVRLPDGEITCLRDLGDGLEYLREVTQGEIRTHFHVPLFLDSFGVLQGTSCDVQATLKEWQADPFCTQLEVETYTWSILPPALKIPLEESITRELEWVIDQLSQ